MAGPFEGRTAVITGAGRGIGRAVAVELAAAGARVVLVSRTPGELADAAHQVRQQGGRALTVTADLGDLEQVNELVARTRNDLGDPDILINNAALATPTGRCAEIDPARWAAAIAVNLVAPAALTFAMLTPMLTRGWGRIVNVSSAVAADPTKMTGANAYVTSKAALEAHTRNLAAELAGSGVTVNVFWPGAVDTALMTYLRDLPPGTVPDELREWAVAVHAEGHLLTAEQAAAALMTHLSGDDNGQIWDAGSPG